MAKAAAARAKLRMAYFGSAQGERLISTRGRWTTVHSRATSTKPMTMPARAAITRRSTHRRRRMGTVNRWLACPHALLRI